MMKRGEVNPATRELEAAEALAGLARFSALHGDGEASRQLPAEAVGTSTRHDSNKDHPIANQLFCNYASNNAPTSREKTDKIAENIPSKLCSTCCQSNPARKLRPKLTQAEKEARKLRRVLTNRESARETIRRRQAMYLELTRKAAEVLEENEHLKKEKEVATEEYNSLRDKNKFLKVQLAKIKAAEAGEKTQAEPNTSQVNKSCSTYSTAPIFLHNHPSLAPCYWPSIFPYSNPCCSHQREENSTGIATQGHPFFVVPVPWLLPFHTHTSAQKDGQKCSNCSCSDARLNEDNNQLYSRQNMMAESSNSRKPNTENHPRSTIVVPGLFTPVRPQEISRTNRDSKVDDTSKVDVVSASESTRNGLSGKNQETVICNQKNSEDVFAANMARRRRKELMKLKNNHCFNLHTRY